MPDRVDEWVVALCHVPRRMHRENRSLLECISESDPDLTDDDWGTEAIDRYLRENPDLVSEWQRESDDTRASPNHYMNEREVGFFDAGFHDRTTHFDEVGACADFVYRKAAWVLARRRVRQEVT